MFATRHFVLLRACATLGAALLVGMAPAAAAGAQPKGDAAKGEKLFAQCKVCHSMDAGKNMIGPSLNRIVGTRAGDVPGYSFSPAMKKSGLKWDAATLSDFLAAPMKKIPGTKMTFAGLAKPQDRADVIAYLSRK